MELRKCRRINLDHGHYERAVWQIDYGDNMLNPKDKYQPNSMVFLAIIFIIVISHMGLSVAVF